MSQLSLYLDDETEKFLSKAARAAGVSRSRWVADLIRGRAAVDWPAAALNAMGSWPDAPSAEELRRGTGTDVPRESF